LANKGLRDEVLNGVNGAKILDKDKSNILNSIIQSDKPLDEKILHLQNATKEIFKTIKTPTAEQKEMYNLVMGLKNTIGIKKKDGLDVITTLIQKGYQRYEQGSGLDHIVFRHYGAGAEGELSTREILNIGKTIQQGTLTKEIAKDIKDKFSTYDNIRVYKRNVNPKDDVNLYVVVGEDRNKIHNVITYYSNRERHGDNLSKSTTGILNKSDLSSTNPSGTITNNDEIINPQSLKTNKSPKEMSTKELIEKNLEVIKKETTTQNHEINSPNLKKEPKNMKTDEIFDNLQTNIKKGKEDILNSQIDEVANIKNDNKRRGIISHLFGDEDNPDFIGKYLNKIWAKITQTQRFKAIENSDLLDVAIGHKLHKNKPYMDEREITNKIVNSHMEDNLKLHEELKLLKPNIRKDMYNYMSGDKNVKLSPQIKTLSDKFIKQIDDIGQELVNEGVLDIAQFKEFQGMYLHRVYTKHLKKDLSETFAKNKKVKEIFSRGKTWQGSQADYDKYSKDGLIGKFQDGKISAQKIIQKNKDGKIIVQKPEDIKYKFRQDYTKEQRQAWGEIEDIAFSVPNTLMRLGELLEHTRFLKKVVKQTSSVSSEPINGFTLLAGKQYGALNGKYVQRSVASDIKEFHQALFGSDGIFGPKATENYKRFNRYWKKNHTVYNAVAHTNNLISNISLQFGAGVNPVTAVKHSLHGYQASVKIGQLRHLEAKF